MAIDVAKELTALQRMGVAALREKYAEVFGEATATGNRTWLICRIAWRMQANAEGYLFERADPMAALQHRTRAGRHSLPHRMELCSLRHHYAISPAFYAVSRLSAASKLRRCTMGEMW